MQKNLNWTIKNYYALTYRYCFENFYYAFCDCLNNWGTQINSIDN